MHRLSVDTGLMMQICQAEMAKYRLGDGDTEKVTERVARDATSKLPWVIAAGVLIGTNLLTAGGMYLWLRATLASLDVRLAAPGAERWRSLIAANPGDLVSQERGRCSPQRGGGTACEFFLWTIPPAPQKAE